MIRILNIIGSMQRGGAETFLINVYRNIDRQKIQFDFLLCSCERENSYIDEIEHLGGKIYVLPPKSAGLVRNLLTIKQIIQENGYQIVWRHTNTPFKAIDLIMAKWGGATHTILHSHSANVRGLVKVSGNLTRRLFLRFVTERYACGVEAGQWMYGKKPYQIIKNGIEIDKFRYNDSVRQNYREKFRLQNCLVIGHIGRFEKVKNQEFLLNILKELVTINRKIVMVFVGEGTLLPEVQKKAKELGVEENTRFLGVRTDIPDILQMMDVFALPSLWEGVPVTLVEAQAAGLPCIVSKNVPEEIKILPSMKFVGLEEAPSVWAGQILDAFDVIRKDESEKVRDAGYDIIGVAKKLQNNFLQMVGK